MLSDGFKLLALAFTEEDWRPIHIPYFVLYTGQVLGRQVGEWKRNTTLKPNRLIQGRKWSSLKGSTQVFQRN